MFKQYFKQAIQMLKENRLTSVISILGTALSIAMILVVILQFQIKLVGFRPESNRGRMLYIMGIRADSRNRSLQIRWLASFSDRKTRSGKRC